MRPNVLKIDERQCKYGYLIQEKCSIWLNHLLKKKWNK